MMIPNRRPRIVRKVQEAELTDDDIVESKPVPTSGTYPAVARPAPPPLPKPKENVEEKDGPPIVRLSIDSISEEELERSDTAMNDITAELARLSLENHGETVPRLRGAVEWNELAPEEALVVSLISVGFNVQAIIDNSPHSE